MKNWFYVISFSIYVSLFGLLYFYEILLINSLWTVISPHEIYVLII